MKNEFKGLLKSKTDGDILESFIDILLVKLAVSGRGIISTQEIMKIVEFRKRILHRDNLLAFHFHFLFLVSTF